MALTVSVPVLPPALLSPSYGQVLAAKLVWNHWTHLVQKAPKANRQELVCRLRSSPSSVSGLPPGGGCLSVLPPPSSDYTAAGTTESCVCLRAPAPLPDVPRPESW